LTYLPILLVANDRAYMGSHANGRFANVVGIAYFILILVVSITAIPLLLLTNVGQG
jgi:manganese transport protein